MAPTNRRLGYSLLIVGVDRHLVSPLACGLKQPNVAYFFCNNGDVTVLASFLEKEQLPRSC